MFALSPLYTVAKTIFFHSKAPSKKTAQVHPNKQAIVSSSNLEALGNVAKRGDAHTHTTDYSNNTNQPGKKKEYFNK